MPIYEFKCKDCGKEFDELLSISAQSNPSCPECSSVKVEKKFSVCAGFSSGSCGGSSGFT